MEAFLLKSYELPKILKPLRVQPISSVTGEGIKLDPDDILISFNVVSILGIMRENFPRNISNLFQTCLVTTTSTWPKNLYEQMEGSSIEKLIYVTASKNRS